MSIQPPRLKLFVKSEEATNWKKTESLRIFAKAGRKVAQLYVIQSPRVLSALAAGKVSAALKADLKEPLQSPIVFLEDYRAELQADITAAKRDHEIESGEAKPLSEEEVLNRLRSRLA